MKDKKRRRRFSFFGLLFFGIVILYFIITFSPIVLSSTIQTEVIKYGSIQLVDHLNFYVVRDEAIVHSNSEGDIKYFVQEGEKVEKGYKILEISKDIVDESTRKKLEVIQQRIDSLNQDSTNLFSHDIEKLTDEANKIILELKEYNGKGDLLKVEELKKELNSKMEKLRIIDGDKSFASKNLDTLKTEEKELENKINSSLVNVSSPTSGIISYHIDGYESILTPHNMTEINIEKLKSFEANVSDLRTSKTILKQPLFKVVDNNIWYMITWVDPQTLGHYKVGKTVTLKFAQGDITGQVYRIIENDKENMMIFRIDEFIPDFYKTRNISLDVVAVNYEGLKIQKDCIIEKDGREGVYVLDINRNAKYKPIKILGYDDEYAILESNVFYEKEGDETKTYSTVKLYDEVVRNAVKIHEGQYVY
ncbi:MAG: HlyD family efflux transporter periplasmic adaptor subunit [Bacillota bacterium]